MSKLVEKNSKVINAIFLRCLVSMFGVYNREKKKIRLCIIDTEVNI